VQDANSQGGKMKEEMLKPFLELFFALVWTFNGSTETTELAETPLPNN
jgi:hypothetical protein